MNSLLKSITLLIVTFICIASLQAKPKFQDQRQLLQLVEYIGVDYSAAVENGQIIDQVEYREMLDFAAIIIEKCELNKELQPSLLELANQLNESINRKLTIADIQVLTSLIKQQLLVSSPQLSLPKTLISENEVLELFSSQCASCHGVMGQGDGVLAKQMTPEPTNFSDKDRAMNRSIMGLHDVISSGLDGTAMSAFTQLNERQRWSLAFHVGAMAYDIDTTFDSKPIVSLSDLVNFSPNEILDSNSKISSREIEQLRANPLPLFNNKRDPFAVALNQLIESEMAYRNNDFVQAKRHAVSAYLDGFELVESSVDIRDKALRKNIEAKLLQLRQLLLIEGNNYQVKDSIEEITNLLKDAQQLVTGTSMSDMTLFSASFIILLREGLEALLVVMALFTVLVRSEKKEAIKYVHYGWSFALVLGVLTWVVAQYLVVISGASREIMEGFAALSAAIILFYVGFWMHNKSQTAQWQRYIQENVNKSLATGTLWGISSLAFIAVYREVFETVLFYQSLMTQAAESQMMVLLAGFVFAILVLVLIAWLMVKYSIKWPIARFFSSTSYLLLLLSFVLMGKGISALQEAAIIEISLMPISYELDWLGVSSNWQSFSAQTIVLLLSLTLILKTKFKTKK